MDRSTINRIISFVQQYKLLHIAFWIWTTLDLIHLQQLDGAPLETALRSSIEIKTGQICCVYFIVYYLMPNFLFKGRYIKFVTLAILAIPGCALLTLLLQDIDKLIRVGQHLKPRYIYIGGVAHFRDAAVISAFFFAIYAVKGRFDTERRNRILEKERLETELNFLKAQINPHFLFNSINSVYVLIDEDKKLASQTLLKFSGLLRYQLYDCTNDQMPLERELEFLKDYVDLEIIRSGSDVEITFDAEPGADYLKIAPFILVPFVENAFKHRSHRKSGNYVRINITVKEDTLHVSVVNTFDDTISDTTHYGGIGLQNVQRRLQLLYPGEHTLKIEQHNGIYCVNLQLKLHEDTMHTGR